MARNKPDSNQYFGRDGFTALWIVALIQIVFAIGMAYILEWFSLIISFYFATLLVAGISGAVSIQQREDVLSGLFADDNIYTAIFYASLVWAATYIVVGAFVGFGEERTIIVGIVSGSFLVSIVDIARVEVAKNTPSI